MIIAYGLLIIFSMLSFILLISILAEDQSDYTSSRGARFNTILTFIFLALCSAQYIWG